MFTTFLIILAAACALFMGTLLASPKHETGFRGSAVAAVSVAAVLAVVGGWML